MRACFVGVTASNGVPKATEERALTSHTASTPSRSATTSSSPVLPERQLRATIRQPRSAYHSAARSSPAAPSGRVTARCWPGRCVESQLLLRELLHVDVLERDDLHVGDEPALAVHVPDPGVPELELDPAAAAVVVDRLRDLVGQVEAPLRLDHVGEHRRDVLVLLVELELDLRLVPLEVLRAHRSMVRPGPEADASAGGPLLLDLGGATDAVPQVVELGPAHVAPGQHLDALEDGRVDREGPLDAHAEAHLADREGLAHAGALALDDDALEHLHPLAAGLHHPDVHLEGVAGGELGDVVAQAGAVDEIGAVHGALGSWGLPGDERG